MGVSISTTKLNSSYYSSPSYRAFPLKTVFTLVLWEELYSCKSNAFPCILPHAQLFSVFQFSSIRQFNLLSLYPSFPCPSLLLSLLAPRGFCTQKAFLLSRKLPCFSQPNTLLPGSISFLSHPPAHKDAELATVDGPVHPKNLAPSLFRRYTYLCLRDALSSSLFGSLSPAPHQSAITSSPVSPLGTTQSVRTLSAPFRELVSQQDPDQKLRLISLRKKQLDLIVARDQHKIALNNFQKISEEEATDCRATVFAHGTPGRPVVELKAQNLPLQKLNQELMQKVFSVPHKRLAKTSIVSTL